MRKATLRAPQCTVDLGRHGAPQGQTEAKPFVGDGFGTANRTKWYSAPFFGMRFADTSSEIHFAVARQTR